MPTPPTPTKPKLITLKELRALCKEAGVEIVENSNSRWDIYYQYVFIFQVKTKYQVPCIRDSERIKLKAYCLGLIAMRKRGEL